MNSETFLQNKKRKEKYSNSKNSETFVQNKNKKKKKKEKKNTQIQRTLFPGHSLR